MHGATPGAMRKVFAGGGGGGGSLGCWWGDLCDLSTKSNTDI